MDMVSLQLGGSSAYPPVVGIADRGTVPVSGRETGAINVNPADRVQSIGLDDPDAGYDGDDEGASPSISYGAFYTNRLIYLDLEAQLLVVQFRDALDREVRLQFPPEMTLRAYRSSGAEEAVAPRPAETPTDPGGEPAADAPALPRSAANDGLPEALQPRRPEPTRSEAADAPVGVTSPKAETAAAPGQKIVLVA